MYFEQRIKNRMNCLYKNSKLIVKYILKYSHQFFQKTADENLNIFYILLYYILFMLKIFKYLFFIRNIL